MSGNGENSQIVPETVEENSEGTGKVSELHKNSSENAQDFVENGSEQNQAEGNLSTENIVEAFFCTLDNQRKELRIIEKHLSETIQKLETSARENADTSDSMKKVLREQIEQGIVLQREIKTTLSLRESREKSMRMQLAKFHENFSLKDSDAGADNMNNNLVITDLGNLTPQTITDSDEFEGASDEELAGKRQMELNFIKTILKAAKIRQKMADAEDSNEESN